MALGKIITHKKYEKTFFALGTINSITAFGVNCEEALSSACQRVIEIDNRMSVFKENSDVTKINRNAGIEAQKINTDTFDVLKRALEISKTSDGAFDITIRPLTALWGFGTKHNFIPDSIDIKKTLGLVDHRELGLDEKSNTAYLKSKGQAIDLGGIAKGYAADEVKRVLQQYDIENALINLGGNIVAMGYNQTGTPWRIGIQNPLSNRGQSVGTIAAVNKTVVTSGSNEQFFIKDGVRYHHIIEPRTGYPANTGILSVTAICESSIDADALTTALFIMGADKAISFLEDFNAEAIFIMQNSDIFITKGLADNFERS